VTRVALVCSEPIGAAMGGIGVRYVEMARHLLAEGFDVRLLSPAASDSAIQAGLPDGVAHRYDPQRRADWLADRDAVVVQGQLGNELVLDDPGLPLVVDLYDPWLVENLAYAPELGLAPYRNDHRSWVLQLGRGDLFLCASEEQRLFYSGFLAALGRLNPRRFELDPTLSGLLAVVPFGCTVGEPIERRSPSASPRLLFGGLYDWYDVDTLVEALERLRAPEWRLVVVRSANPDSTPQRQLARLEAASRRRGWWEERIELVERVPASDRRQLFAASDLLVAPHAASLESDLSFRTRFLEALAVGCPVVATRGGALAREVARRDAGWVVPAGDPEALAAAIDEVLADGPEVEARRGRGLALAAEHGWPQALRPLVDFLRQPRVDPTREEFAFRPETVAPHEGAAGALWRRARRRLRR
jgi:glycosyltransferase involved in cell wall biosynthesis